MVTFAGAFALFGAVLLVANSPLAFLAWRAEKQQTAKKFTIAALCVAAFCALLSLSSQRLVDQCLAERNFGCVDIGAVGMQSLVCVGFVAVSWFVAWGLRP